MKIRVSDYIAQLCAEHGIRTAFSVVGGGAMNLNDSFGHSDSIKVIYNHHEQACAIAAEGYARVNNEPAAVIVTTGPGGTNALTGVVGAYVDSVPMVVISGQVRRDSFSITTGLPLRAMGDQEFNIVPCAATMTKYAEVILDKNDVRFVMEKALYLATHGRMGPVWVDVPGDIQSATVETDSLVGYTPDYTVPCASDEDADFIIDKIRTAKRPVFYAGSAIRLSGAYDVYKRVIEKLNIPVVTAWNSTDIVENSHRLYAGRAGNFGDRFGNFTVQNSDFILSVGCRLSIRQTGFNYASWAPKAFVAMVDIDENEMKKPTIHVEYPIHSDARLFLEKLDNRLSSPIEEKKAWIKQCKEWQKEYPILKERYFEQSGKANVYAVINELSRALPDDMITVSGNGAACVVGGQVFEFRNKMRFIENSGMASMGYDLPAAIGACFANGKKAMVCLTGDGSIQMNLQELQTIIHHRLPIKIIVINNDGYHSIRQSQSNFFKGRELCGIGEDSHDLSFPDLEKIAWAYGYPFVRCNTNEEFSAYLKSSLFADEVPQIVEVMTDKVQYFEPKAGSKRLEDGSMVSAPLEDLAPYLDRDELEKVMEVSQDDNA